MPNTYGRAFTTANFLANLAALKAINFGASDPRGVWFVVPNQTTNNVEIWVWEPTSTATTNDLDVIRPDSIVPGSPGRCVQSLKFDASSLGGILAAIASLNTAGLIERTADGSASIVGLGSFARSFLGSASDTAARTALNLNLVNNTSDTNKPVSTAQQAALNLKADLINGFIPSSQLPSYVDDMLEFATLGDFPVTGETGKIYVATDTNITYRWAGTGYVEISASLALGTTSATAYRGDFGNTAYLHSQETGNPHGTTAAQVGLPNVTNHLQVNTTEAQTVGGDKTFTGIVTFANTTQATTTTNGSVRYLGGISVVGNIVTGGSIIQTINYIFKAGASISQAIPNATWTKVNLDTEVVDTNSQYNPTISRLTAITTEVWRINLFVTVEVASANTRILLSVWKNGAEVAGTSRLLDVVRGIGGEASTLTINEFPLVASDYLEVYCYTTPASSVAGEPSLIAVSWNGKRVN